MDGISVAASVIAVIQITQSVGLFLRDLYRDIRDARTEIEQLYDSVVSLEIIAKGLDDLLKRRGVEMMNKSLLEDPQGPLKKALSEVKAVKEKLDAQVVNSRFEKIALSVKESVKRSLKWPFKKEEVLDIVARLDNRRSNLLLDVDINTLSIQFDQSDILQDIKKDIAAAQFDSHRRRMINWLSSSVPDPSLEHNKALKLHEETTGSWLVDGDDFKQWAVSPNSYAWIHGSAGAGKSILCSTAINHIQSICKNEPNTAVVYWYFTFRDPASQIVDHCIRSLVTNLCSKRADTPKALQEAYEQCNNGQLSPSTKSLMVMLNAAIDGFDDVYVFLDALDECPKSGKQQEHERDNLMGRLHEMCSWNKEGLHILTTSRKERDIEESLVALFEDLENFKEISVHGSLVEKDIRKYIRQSLKARQFNNWRPHLKEEVENTLATQANGMFRLVGLQLDVLLKSKSVAAIKKALNALPVTLDEFYDYVLRAIDDQYGNQASIALQWLAYSARPLSLSELAEAIVIQPREDPCFDPEERFMDENQILDVLPAGFIQKVFREQPREDGRWLDPKSQVAFIEFAHFSVLEFLKSTRLHPDLRAQYHIEELKAHKMIAESCLLYMLYVGSNEDALAMKMSKRLRTSMNDYASTESYEESKANDGDGGEAKDNTIGSDQQPTENETDYDDGEDNNSSEEGSMKDSETWQVLCRQVDRYVLAAYTNRAWQYHMSRLQQHDPNSLTTTLALEFLNVNGNSWNIWCFFTFDDWAFNSYGAEEISTYLQNTPNNGERLWKIPPITWISFLGISDLLMLLIKQAPHLPPLQKTPSFGSPLHAASARGNLQEVQILLSCHVDVNEKSGNWRYPLSAAVHSGALSVVKVLLRSGADVNFNIDYSNMETALMAACAHGSLDMVKLLVEAGADVNAVVYGTYGTALMAASLGGSLEMVKFLLASDAEVNLAVEESLNGTPLATACRWGRLEIAKLLLEVGADVNAGASSQSLALREAVHPGRINVIRILLDAGANIGSKEEPQGAYQVAGKWYEHAHDKKFKIAQTYKEILRLLDDHLETQ